VVRRCRKVGGGLDGNLVADLDEHPVWVPHVSDRLPPGLGLGLCHPRRSGFQCRAKCAFDVLGDEGISTPAGSSSDEFLRKPPGKLDSPSWFDAKARVVAPVSLSTYWLLSSTKRLFRPKVSSQNAAVQPHWVVVCVEDEQGCGTVPRYLRVGAPPALSPAPRLRGCHLLLARPGEHPLAPPMSRARSPAVPRTGRPIPRRWVVLPNGEMDRTPPCSRSLLSPHLNM
jgi:hypothetical protein